MSNTGAYNKPVPSQVYDVAWVDFLRRDQIHPERKEVNPHIFEMVLASGDVFYYRSSNEGGSPQYEGRYCSQHNTSLVSCTRIKTENSSLPKEVIRQIVQPSEPITYDSMIVDSDPEPTNGHSKSVTVYDSDEETQQDFMITVETHINIAYAQSKAYRKMQKDLGLIYTKDTLRAFLGDMIKNAEELQLAIEDAKERL